MEELIEKALNGNIEVYTELILSISPELLRIARTRLSAQEDIDDAIQETLIKSYQNLNKLTDYNSFKPWIIKILINECNMIYRKKYKQSDLLSKLFNSETNKITQESLQFVEDDIDFEILINKLNYNDKLIATLYYKNRYTPTEISEILDTNVNTIKSKILRIKKKLQKYIKEGLDNETRE